MALLPEEIANCWQNRLRATACDLSYAFRRFGEEVRTGCAVHFNRLYPCTPRADNQPGCWPQSHSGHRLRVRSTDNAAAEVRHALEQLPEVKEILFFRLREVWRVFRERYSISPNGGLAKQAHE